MVAAACVEATFINSDTTVAPNQSEWQADRLPLGDCWQQEGRTISLTQGQEQAKWKLAKFGTQ